MTAAAFSLAASVSGFGALSAHAQNAAGAMGTTPLVLGVEDGSPGFTENFNPFSPNQLNAVMYMFEPLVIINPLNGAQTPWLATSYRWVNNKTLVFTIRSGVKWSDGSPFSAADVAFTFNLMHKYSALDTNSLWTSLSSVTAAGDHVTFRFKTPNVPDFSFIASTPIVPMKQWSKVKNPVTFTNDDPIGTGPYTLDFFHSSEIMLNRNPKYWQQSLIKVPQLEYLALQGNQTSDLMLAEGKFDESVLFTPNIQKTYVDQNPKYYHYWFPLSAPITLRMNLTKFPFNQVKFRQAMAYAINKQQLYMQGEYGYEPPANQSLLPPSQQAGWLDKSLQAKYPYNYSPSMAAKLLAQLGLKKNAAGLLIGPDKKPLTMTIQVPTGWTDWIQDCEIIKSELAGLGITVNVNTPSVTTDMNNLYTGNFDMALMYEGSYSNPWFVYDQVLASDESAPIGKIAVSNFERWMNPRTDALLKEYEGATSPAVQHRIIDQLQQIMYTQLPVVNLVYGAAWNEYQTNNYVGWPTQSDQYAMPSNSYPDNLLIITHLRPAH